MFQKLKKLFGFHHQSLKNNNPPTKESPKVFKNPDGSYMSPDQIVDDIIKYRLGDKETYNFIKTHYVSKKTDEQMEAEQFTGMNVDGFAKSNFARWIRNSYGLWHSENPYVVIDAQPNKDRILDDTQFPDNVSALIMEKLTERLNAPN